MVTTLTLLNTGYLAEWWHQVPGERPRYYTFDHIAGVIARTRDHR